METLFFIASKTNNSYLNEWVSFVVDMKIQTYFQYRLLDKASVFLDIAKKEELLYTRQFDQPIAGFQLTQKKLVDMMVATQRGTLVALHLGRMKDAGTLATPHVSVGKLDNVRMALEVAREARSLLGANGITLEYPVIRHMTNLESVYTYEGTNEIHTLILGNAITGIPAFG